MSSTPTPEIMIGSTRSNERRWIAIKRWLLPMLCCAGLACGDSGSGGGGAAGGTAEGGAGNSEPASCADRCATRAQGCGQPESLCSDLCAGSPSADAVSCLESLPCTADEAEATACLSGGGNGGGGGNGNMCVPVGGTGCHEDAGGTDDCCDLGECEAGSCCYPSNFPNLLCTDDAQCCTGTCQMDPNQTDVAVKYCQ